LRPIFILLSLFRRFSYSLFFHFFLIFPTNTKLLVRVAKRDCLLNTEDRRAKHKKIEFDLFSGILDRVSSQLINKLFNNKKAKKRVTRLKLTRQCGRLKFFNVNCAIVLCYRIVGKKNVVMFVSGRFFSKTFLCTAMNIFHIFVHKELRLQVSDLQSLNIWTLLEGLGFKMVL
jgi:hypothetical protein